MTSDVPRVGPRHSAASRTFCNALTWACRAVMVMSGQHSLNQTRPDPPPDRCEGKGSDLARREPSHAEAPGVPSLRQGRGRSSTGRRNCLGRAHPGSGTSCGVLRTGGCGRPRSRHACRRSRVASREPRCGPAAAHRGIPARRRGSVWSACQQRHHRLRWWRPQSRPIHATQTFVHLRTGSSQTSAPAAIRTVIADERASRLGRTRAMDELPADETLRRIADLLDERVPVEGSEEMSLDERVRDVVLGLETWSDLAIRRLHEIHRLSNQECEFCASGSTTRSSFSDHLPLSEGPDLVALSARPCR